ncbi:cytochrome P450 6j1-like [Diabrotica virgifera virgifera]|uniref:Cytochrome P450 6k1-like n=1 Tax=Diabrotica virgifera virgifera TaxID=50390 RepID=A0ABM5KUI7_DIAVI|nr:cytochrome P450 6j1-like [Diabrotica virgifera virgifera]
MEANGRGLCPAVDEHRLKKKKKKKKIHMILKGLHNMYFVLETLRKYGVLPFLDREAVNDYRLESTDLVIEKGMTVYIHLFAFMRDPKYFPYPLKFDPERLADKNFNTDELLYFPFGDRPKACIGKRLGLLALGACLSHVLLNFKIEKCE